MFDFIKNKMGSSHSSSKNSDNTEEPKASNPQDTAILASEQPQAKNQGFFSRLKSGLSKTRRQFSNQLANIFLGKKEINAELLEELEYLLLTADIGVDTTQQIIQHLTQQVSRRSLKDPSILITTLKEYLIELLHACEQPLEIPTNIKPYVILMVGINGAGKTTTIGKIAKQLTIANKQVMLAAGDTFRAAAIEQLSAWGERNQIPVVSQHTGADSASVVYDAFHSAQTKGYDVLLADTAGRLHTQTNLMEELKKISRILKKLDENAPHETLLVLDASIGQNALNQALKFHEATHVSGLAITKLDGTAKGGIIFAIAAQLKLPIRFIGFGEGIDDLKPFNAKDFVEALFTKTED